MKRAWGCFFAVALLGIGVLVACGGNGKSDALQSMAGVAVAQENGGAKGCSLIGGWITLAGDSYTPWTTTNTGSSEASGTAITVAPSWPAPITGPDGQPVPINPQVIFTGAWKRTGGNTFAFTQMGFIRLPNGVPILVAKNVGTQTISDDCNYITIESTMDVTELDGKTSKDKQDLPPMHGHRVLVEPYVPVGP